MTVRNSMKKDSVSPNTLNFSSYAHCMLCPRRCGARRTEGKRGICGATDELHVARAALHFWEEPPISGKRGSGAIFFSGCPLRCVFCQNHEISQEGFGLAITTKRLAQIMLELQSQGALNINLVTPLHFAPHVRRAILLARKAGLELPIICNTSGYESIETLQAVEDVIDIWLTDFKYASQELSGRLSKAPDYPEVASAALTEMLRQLLKAGGRLQSTDGRMFRGIIVRHLVLPGHADDSCAVLDRIWELCGNEVDVSVMNQYTPNTECLASNTELAHAVSDHEYERVLDHSDDLGFERLWWQQGGTVSESFIPAFDATGVTGPELGQT
jgi:putative pyruvate formate lyase activating enzyme